MKDSCMDKGTVLVLFLLLLQKNKAYEFYIYLRVMPNEI